MFQTNIQSYINNFRRHLAGVLKPGIGMTCTVYPAEAGGAVLEFSFGLGLQNDDRYNEPSTSLGAALALTKQSTLQGNLLNAIFGGTNIVLERNLVLFIKDNQSKEWTDAAAIKDAGKILSQIQDFK